MNDETESRGAGHNFNKALSNDVLAGSNMIESLKSERQATNAKINEIRLEMEGKGIPRVAFDLAMRIAGWDEDKMQAFDYAYIFCRGAIGNPVEPDLFSATDLNEIKMKDKFDESQRELEHAKQALADATIANNRLLKMHTTVRDMEAPEYLEYEDAGARYAAQVAEQKRAANAAIEGKEYEPPKPNENAPDSDKADENSDNQAGNSDIGDESANTAAEIADTGEVAAEPSTEHDSAEEGATPPEETADEQQAREIAHVQGDDGEWDAADPARQGNAPDAVDVENSEEVDGFEPDDPAAPADEVDTTAA